MSAARAASAFCTSGTHFAAKPVTLASRFIFLAVSLSFAIAFCALSSASYPVELTMAPAKVMLFRFKMVDDSHHGPDALARFGSGGRYLCLR